MPFLKLLLGANLSIDGSMPWENPLSDENLIYRWTQYGIHIYHASAIEVANGHSYVWAYFLCPLCLLSYITAGCSLLPLQGLPQGSFEEKGSSVQVVPQTGFCPARQGAEAVRISGTVGRGIATTLILKKQWDLGTRPWRRLLQLEVETQDRHPGYLPGWPSSTVCWISARQWFLSF